MAVHVDFPISDSLIRLMQDQQFNLSHWPIEELLELIRRELPGFKYDHKKHNIQLIDSQNNQMAVVRLPLHYQIDENLDLISDEANALYLSVESGNAAICMMLGVEMDYHTTFSAYMTRKKQGFSQIKYLNKKGKSRAGSRVRLAETMDFFESINTTLHDLMEEYEVDRLALDCTKTLLPYVMQSRVAFPVDKKDPMIYKIPLHLPQSNFTNLENAIAKLKIPMLIYDPSAKDMLLNLME